MNIKRIFLSIAVLVFAGAVVIGGTGAFFSDTERSEANTFTSGSIDLTVDSVAHYNGMICFDDVPGLYRWLPESEVDWNETTEEYELDTTDIEAAILAFNSANVALVPQAGDECAGTWDLRNLGGQDVPATTFFDYADLKPGDSGENTISLHVVNNDAWACAIIDNMTDNDLGLTEPEMEDGDNTDGFGNGELSQEVHFFAWADDGDNEWEQGEQMLFNNTDGPASDVLDGRAYPLHTALTSNGTLGAGVTEYIGLYWCYGDIIVTGNDLSCDSSNVTNITQSDELKADIGFYVEQARNNPNFTCPEPRVLGDPIGAALDDYVLPSVCDAEVDDDGYANYATIQDAIDDPSLADGSTVCVDSGSYSEFALSRPLTITGMNNPEGPDAAVVSPSGAAVTEIALITSSNVTITGIKFDGNGVISAGSQMAGVQVSPAGADVDNVHITYNVVTDLEATNGNAANKGIQWHDGSSSGAPVVAYSLTNSSFANNVISDISSVSKGAYGVQTVGDMDGVNITYNTVSNVSGAWGAGIAIDAHQVDESLTSVLVGSNELTSGIWGNVSVQVEHKVDQTGVAVNGNNVLFLVHGSGTPATGADVNAENNWWGDTDPSDNVSGPVDFTPFSLLAFPVN